MVGYQMSDIRDWISGVRSQVSGLRNRISAAGSEERGASWRLVKRFCFSRDRLGGRLVVVTTKMQDGWRK